MIFKTLHIVIYVRKYVEILINCANIKNYVINFSKSI